MKAATKVLPPSYSLYRHFDETKYKKVAWVVIVLGGLVFWASFIFFNYLAGVMRPDYQMVERLQFQLSAARILTIFRVLLPVAMVLILHECIHVVLLWLHTRERPSIIVSIEGIAGISVSMPSWYLSRNAFLKISLAPVYLITLLIPFLLLIVPSGFINTLVFCAALNIAGSLSDIMSSIYIYTQPASVYLTTEGQLFRDQGSLNIPGWKQRIQHGIEWLLTKLK
jgi:NAD/NADP transhydrogenase beta subunit